MKTLITLALLLFAQLSIPQAPTGLSVGEAALVQKLPRCSLGNGFDADKDGTIDTGCTGAANHFAATGTGYAVQVDSCGLAGTAASFTDANADGGTAARIPAGNSFLSGQIRCLVTPAAGTYTVKVRVRMPNSGKTDVWMATEPMLFNPQPSTSQRTILNSDLQQLTYQWFTIGPTVNSSGAQVALYFVLDDSLEADCIYIDVSAVTTPTCPGATVPFMPDYVMLETNSGVDGNAATLDDDWVNANAISVFGFTGSSNVCSAKFLRQDAATDRIHFRITCTDTNLNAPTTGADNTAIAMGGDDYVEITIAPTSPGVYGSTMARYAVNIAATLSILDANYDSGGNLLTAFNGSCAATRAIVGDLDGVADDTSWTIEGSCNMPFNPVTDQGGVMQVLIGDADATFTHNLWKGGALDANNLSIYGKVQFSGTAVPAPPPDATDPVLSAPTFTNIGNNSMRISATCTDAGGCASGRIEYDSNSGTPYCNAAPGTGTCPQTAVSITGTPPDFIITGDISGLAAGTTYHVRVCGTDGAGNTGCGSEDNRPTTSTAGLFISTDGGGTVCSNDFPCALSRLTTPGVVQPGQTWNLKNGTYNLSNHLTISCPAVSNGTDANPITLRAENERQALLQPSSGSTDITLIRMFNCSHWKFQGLHIRNRLVTGGVWGEGLEVWDGTNIDVTRNLFQTNNHYTNSHLLIFYRGRDILIEENEFYDHHRHATFISGGQNYTFNRNYCNSRGAQVAPGGHGDGGGDAWNPGGDTCITIYSTVSEFDNPANILLQNNISEGNYNLFDVQAVKNDVVGVTALGNISINEFRGVDLIWRNDTGTTRYPRDIVMKDMIIIGANQYGVGSRITRGNTVLSQSSIFNSPTGVYSDNWGLGTESGSNFIMTNVYVQGSGVGFNLNDLASFSVNFPTTRGNAVNYLGQATTNNNSLALSSDEMGSCRAIIPASAKSLKGTGQGGADRGGNVRYPYVDGTLRTDLSELWDFSQGGASRGVWRSTYRGATVSGVNSDTANSLVGVHLRLGYGNGACLSPVSTGDILVQREGELVGSGIASAPYGTTQINALSAVATNPNTATGLAAGSHTVKASDVIGLVETVGTCTYTIGTTACTVDSWPTIPTCDLTECVVNITVDSGQVTKVSFKYTGVYEGFGLNTVGGKNGSLCTVSNTNDSGAGSLRNCLGSASQFIVFSTSGTIALSTPLLVERANITIDGFTSPTGITITGQTLLLTTRHGTVNDARDIIIRGLRIDANNDELDNFWWALGVTSLATPVSNVVIDHNSISNSWDDALAMGAHDATVSWNIIARPQVPGSGGGLGISQGVERVTYHHNLWGLQPNSFGQNRHPLVDWHCPACSSSGPPVISADFRNNLHHVGLAFEGADGGEYGLWAYLGAKVNIIKNYFVGTPGVESSILKMRDVIVTCGGNKDCSGLGYTDVNAEIAFVDGNTIKPAFATDHNVTADVNAGGGAISAPAITEATPLIAACDVIAQVGARPLSAADQTTVNDVAAEVARFDTC